MSKEKKTVCRLVRHGEEHAVEVTTPGWRGVDAAFAKTGKGVWAGAPRDLKQIAAVLDQAKLQPYRTLLMADGTTEFVLRNAIDAQAAATALAQAGWLRPAV